MFQPRPIVAAIDPLMVEEFKLRKKALEDITGRKTKDGLTCYSKWSAIELKLFRLSSEELLKEIFKFKDPPIKKFLENGNMTDYVLYSDFIKLFKYINALNLNKKDNKKIILEIERLKGTKKNEINFIY